MARRYPFRNPTMAEALTRQLILADNAIKVQSKQRTTAMRALCTKRDRALARGENTTHIIKAIKLEGRLIKKGGF